MLFIVKIRELFFEIEKYSIQKGPFFKNLEKVIYL